MKALLTIILAAWALTVALSEGRSETPHCRAVDGDTVECGGVMMRLLGDGAPNVSGIDTPETHRAKCKLERTLGEAAKLRLEELLPTVTAIEDSNVKDRFNRHLVKLRLATGETAGAVLIREGHAVRWTPHYKAHWCNP